MIRITYDEILTKIEEKTGYSRATIEDLINKKIKQLSGLITKEGAAHIVANELGIKLFEKISGNLQIKNILLGMRNVDLIAKVKNNFGVREFNTNGRQGKVASLIVADETGTIRVVLWNELADKAKDIKPGDIIEIKSAYARGRDDNKELHLNSRSEIIINPKGKTVNVDFSNFKKSYTRKTIEELGETDKNVEVRLTIVQAFEPKFYEVCPECGRKLVLQEGGLACPTHGKVEPKQAYVMNLIGDDGTGTIRLVFFKDQVLKVLNKNQDDILIFKDSPEEFDNMKKELLGTEIVVKGRVNLNKLFGRKEFIVEDVEPPQYEKEEKIISEEIKKHSNSLDAEITDTNKPADKDSDDTMDFNENI